MTELKLTITHYKILHTVQCLNDLKLYPKQEGVFKILSGVIDEETKPLKDIPTFGCLISYSSKKISRFILALLRHNYLKKIFDRKTNDLYLIITNEGSISLQKFIKRHKNPYSKANKKLETTIAKID